MPKRRMYESHAEKLKAYRERDRERHNRKRREWAASNADKNREIKRRWYENNKHKLRASWAARDALDRNAEGSHTQEDINCRLVLQRYRCALCQVSLKARYEIDHIVPLSRGGTNYPSNIQMVCPSCNRSKGAKDQIAFMQARGWLL